MLGAPVSWSAEEGAAGRIAAGEARHAEVGELYLAVRGDENVGGLDVAMNDALAMSDAERGSDVADPGTGAGKRNGALFENAVEWLAVDEFHDEIGSLRGLVDAHVMQHENAGMRDLADDAGFLKEFFAGFAGSDFLGEDFDGDDAADVRVVRTDDAAEGACADCVEDFVTTDFHVSLPENRETTARVRIEGCEMCGE